MNENQPTPPNYNQVANQWTFETSYPNHQDFEVLFKEIVADDTSSTTTTNGGKQLDIPQKYDTLQHDFLKWLEWQLQFKNMHDFKCIKSWIIYYDQGGYQGAHVHTGELDYNKFSAVIHLDDVVPTPEHKFNGMLWTLMPEPDGFQHPQHFQSRQGGVVCLDGRVWHGVYPTNTMRRTIVYDIEYQTRT